MDIEEVAARRPRSSPALHVDPLTGFQPFHARRLCFGAGIPAERDAARRPTSWPGAYRAFVETDAMLVEINPLIVTPEGELRALDSKFTVDDNALFRHPDIAEMRDLGGARPAGADGARAGRHLRQARRHGRHPRQRRRAGDVDARRGRRAGGTPANFLDVGGGAQADEIVTALEVLLSDAKVRAVLFNIFGGITRCDEVARGILTALERLDVERADRRAARRHQRRGGPQDPGRRRAAQRVRRADDARRRRARRRAGGEAA